MTGLSAPKTIFGVHAFTFFDRATKLPYGTLKCIGSVQMDLNGQFVDLFGGSSRFAFDSEAGTLDASIKLNTKQFDSHLFTRALGASVTTNTAEASGNVGTLTNQKGTSVKAATTGIASVAAKSGSESDLKDGLYVVKAVSTTTVDVYCLNDVDFNKGTPEVFQDDTMKITATALTVVAATGVDVPGFGLTLTGGSGTIGMVVGDTAFFYVRKQNSGSDIIVVGQATAEFTEFGVIWTSQKKGTGDVNEIYVPRAKAIGLPLGWNEKAWATADVTIKALHDASEDCVYKMRQIRA